MVRGHCGIDELTVRSEILLDRLGAMIGKAVLAPSFNLKP